MAWTRSKLEQMTSARLAMREKLKPVERAALAYARWQGLTDEQNVDPAMAKQSLDRALDELDEQPELWLGIKDLADELGDAVVIGLMRHSMSQGVQQLREASLPTDSADDDEPPAPSPTRKKGRSL